MNSTNYANTPRVVQEECRKASPSELFISRLESQVHRAHTLLDELSRAVAPISVELITNAVKNPTVDHSSDAPFIAELHRLAEELDCALDRLQYIKEKINI